MQIRLRALQIAVRLLAHLKELSNNMSELRVKTEDEDGTVRSVVNALSKQLREQLIDPKTGELAPAMLVAVNGKLASLNSRLKENDVVTFIPPIDGG
jgi:molybdopterin converting factor small subunit